MITIQDVHLTFNSEAELDKAIAIVDNELPWLSNTIEAGCLNGHQWFMKFEDELTVESLETFIKAWKEQN